MSIERLHEIWPEWTVQEQIGEGSFGRVYRAAHVEQGVSAFAAIKVISIPQTKSEIDSLRSEGIDENGTRTYFEGIVNDFVNEIKLMHSLKGIQNIVGVEDFRVVEKVGEIGWDIFIRMELLTPFNTYVSDKKLSEAEVIKLGIDICTALEICGKRNIIHRDIKPENIFVNDYGFYKLGDFGIARKMENMTGGLSQKGTFNYMAPEVANSSYYDARVDTYSLGIVLYKLLNGNRLPFLDSEKQLLNPNDRRIAVERRIHGEPLSAPCEASPAMGNLILRACAYDPNQRFATASDMKRALEAVANGSYVAIPVDVDATTAVRHAKSDLDGTTAVRRAQPEAKAKQQETFGKKKSKAPKIIAIIAAIAIVIAGAAISVPKLLGDKDNNPSSSTEATQNSTEKADSSEDTVDYSKFDDEQIAAIIEEADALAQAEDYEGAQKKIQSGLATYPKSTILKSESDKYALVIFSKEKEELLKKASEEADNGNVLNALNIIKQAQKEAPDDEDYKKVYGQYKTLYVNSIISEAEELTNSKNYDTAIKLCSDAQKNVDDPELQNEIHRIEELKPVSVDITSLKEIDADMFFPGPSKSIAYDTYGNTYDRPIVFDGASDFVTLYSAAKYSTLSGVIAAHSGYEKDYSAVITIYADDVLIYTSPTITRTTKPVNVSVGISRAELITIKSTGNINYGDNEGAIVKLFVSTGDPIIAEANSSLDYKSNQDVSLLKEVTSDFFYSGPSKSLVSDTYGNTYDRPIVFDGASDFVTLYSAAKYSTLSGVIAAHSGYEKDYSAVITIYADDVLIYTSPTITRTTKPVNVSVGISRAELITIKSTGNINYGDNEGAIVKLSVSE